MKGIKKYFQLVALEFKKVLRSPVILLFMLFSPIIIVASLGIFSSKLGETNTSNLSNNIVFVKNGDEVPTNLEDIFKESFGIDRIDWTEDMDSAKYELKLEHKALIVYVDTQTNPTNCIVYYNPYSIKSSLFLGSVERIEGKYSYITLKDFLSDYGVEIDDSYFKMSTDKPVEDYVNIKAIYAPVILILALSFLILISVATMFSKDNETGQNRILGFTPIKISDHILPKFTILFALCLVQCLILIALLPVFGIGLYGSYVGSVALLLLYCAMFAWVCIFLSIWLKPLGMISVGLMSIILPMIIFISSDFASLSTLLRFILLICPSTSGSLLLKSQMYYDIVNMPYLIVVCSFFAISITATFVSYHLKYKRNKRRVLAIK